MITLLIFPPKTCGVAGAVEALRGLEVLPELRLCLDEMLDEFGDA